jgi:pimeloyl-ACP methyl ester carboxylesterase
MIDTGSGPAILMAHGMELDHRLFKPQVAALSGSFRTIAYDLRARSPRGEQPYDLYDLVDDLIGLLDDRGIDRCVLVGMSMGGFTAVRAAHRHPDRIAGLVLIGSAGVPYSREDIEHWSPAYEAVRDLPRLPPAQARADAELHFSLRTRRLRPELVDLWTDRIADRSGIATYHEYRTWAQQDDLSAHLGMIKAPTLIVHGDEDTAVPLTMALETHSRIPHSRLMVLPYAAHAVNLECPDVVSDAIRTLASEIT